MMKKLYILLIGLLINMTGISQPCNLSLHQIGPCNNLCSASIFIWTNPANNYHVFINGVFNQTISQNATIGNLCPGQYVVYITDSVSCSQTDTFNIQQGTPLNVTLNTQNATCSNCFDGQISAAVTGGFSPYSYSWSHGTITQGNVVHPGSYCVTVTDWIGCTAVQCDTVGYFTGLSMISGKVFIDADTNGIIGMFEPLVNNINVQVNPGPFNVITWNNNNSFPYHDNYHMVIPNGNYTVSVLPPGAWQQTSTPITYNITLVDTFISGFDFGVLPDTSTMQGNINLYHSYNFRCNQNGYYGIQYSSNSMHIAQGEIYLDLDPQLSYISANPPPQSITGNTYYWTFDSLMPYHYNSIYLHVMVPGAGSVVTSTSYYNMHDALGTLIFADTSSKTKTVSCAWDPNDKQVEPEGTGSQNAVPLNSELDFTIRFQNTGNDTAFVVVIKDTLDADLDLSTFEIIAASHEMYAQMDPGGILTFTFDNILLPDSNVNESASHGFVRYRIKPMSPVTDPTVITNTAHIIFDQNPAIVTNTTLTTFSDNLLSVAEIKGNGIVKAYPNPFSNEVLIQFEKNISAKAELYDYLGRVLKNYAIFNTSSFVINRNDLKNGLYLLKITTDDSSTTLKLVVK